MSRAPTHCLSVIQALEILSTERLIDKRLSEKKRLKSSSVRVGKDPAGNKLLIDTFVSSQVVVKVTVYNHLSVFQPINLWQADFISLISETSDIVNRQEAGSNCNTK